MGRDWLALSLSLRQALLTSSRLGGGGRGGFDLKILFITAIGEDGLHDCAAVLLLLLSPGAFLSSELGGASNGAVVSSALHSLKHSQIPTTIPYTTRTSMAGRIKAVHPSVVRLLATNWNTWK